MGAEPKLKPWRRLERKLGLVLPEPYIEILRRFPEYVRGMKDSSGRPLSEYALLESADAVVELNERVRQSGEWTPQGGPWPQKFLAIGEDMCGNYYAIDTARDGDQVFFFDHESGRWSLVAESVDAFADEQVRDEKAFQVLDSVTPAAAAFLATRLEHLPALERPSNCPRCGSSHVREIRYIEFSDGMLREEGDCVFGGYFVRRGQPDWKCAACEHEWYVDQDPKHAERVRALEAMIDDAYDTLVRE